MRRKILYFSLVVATVMISWAAAQPPFRPNRGPGEGGSKSDPAEFVQRMLTFDANQDGQLTKDEITDERLVSLFERADSNHDGIVTKDELLELNAKELTSNQRGFDGDGPGRRGPPGEGFDGPPPGGPPPGGSHRMTEILPPPVRDKLNLSAAQIKKIEALQKSVDAKLAQILTDQQNRQLAEMRHRGPGGPDRRGGPGGPDGPDGDRRRSGPPPDGPNGNRRRPPDN